MSQASYLDEQLAIAKCEPGTAEFLSTLLTARGNKCPHFPKLRPGRKSNVPHRVGFFHATDGNITCLETNRVCQKCYSIAVPSGFNVWSTNYPYSRLEGLPSRRIEDGTKVGPKLYNYYPRMIEAGTEGFEDNPQAEAKLYPQTPMPASAEADEAFRWLQESGKPFYIDHLHLSKPWDPNAVDKEAQSRRVAEENAVAYLNAAQGVAATGVGGTGHNTIAEQRILEIGNRLVTLPSQMGNGHPRAATHDLCSQQGEHVSFSDEVYEVSEYWLEEYKMPSQQRIDEVQQHMTGEVTHPTEGEVERRVWDEERTSVSQEEVLRLRGGSVEERRRAVNGLNFQHSGPQESTNRSQYLNPKTSRIRDGRTPTTENLKGIARTVEKRVDTTERRIDRTNSASNTTGRNPRAKEPMLPSSLGPVESGTTKLKPRKRLDQLEQESSTHNASRDVPLQRPNQSNTEGQTRKLSIAATRSIRTQRPELAPIASESTPLRQQSSRLKDRATSVKTRRPIAYPEPDPGVQVGNMNPSLGGVQGSRNSQPSSETSVVKMNSSSTQINQPVCNIATQQSYAPQSNRNIATTQRTPVKASGAKPGSRNATATAGAPIRPVIRPRAPQPATASQHRPSASAQPAILTPSSPRRIRMPRQNVFNDVHDEVTDREYSEGELDESEREPDDEEFEHDEHDHSDAGQDPSEQDDGLDEYGEGDEHPDDDLETQEEDNLTDEHLDDDSDDGDLDNLHHDDVSQDGLEEDDGLEDQGQDQDQDQDQNSEDDIRLDGEDQEDQGISEPDDDDQGQSEPDIGDQDDGDNYDDGGGDVDYNEGGGDDHDDGHGDGDDY